MTRYDEIQALTDAWNNAWNSRNPDELASFFAADSTYYEPDLSSGPVSGPSGVAEAAKKTWADWPNAQFTIVSMTIEDSRVVLEWRSTATHRTGKSVNLEGVDILDWQDSKIASARVYYDEHSRKRQLGDA